MKKACFVFACVLLGSLLLVSASSSASYDPWVDLDDNGLINIFDVVTLANSYQTTGDPTKTVAVTNWPQTEEILEWWMYPLADGATVASYDTIHANGYATLHVLAIAVGLSSGEAATFYVTGTLWDAGHTVYYPIPAYQQTLTDYAYYAAVTLSVPSDEFYFAFQVPLGTACVVSLSYYLTWS